MEYFRFLLCLSIVIACLMIGFGCGVLYMELKNKNDEECKDEDRE